MDVDKLQLNAAVVLVDASVALHAKPGDGLVFSETEQAVYFYPQRANQALAGEADGVGFVRAVVGSDASPVPLDPKWLRVASQAAATKRRGLPRADSAPVSKA